MRFPLDPQLRCTEHISAQTSYYDGNHNFTNMAKVSVAYVTTDGDRLPTEITSKWLYNVYLI